MNQSIQLITARKIRAAIMAAATVAFVVSSVSSLPAIHGPDNSSSRTELALETRPEAPVRVVKQ